MLGEMEKIDVVIIGAGAAGLMCAIEAGKRKRRVLLLDHANKVGKKILMSGGGRCNFTNYHIHSDNYISHNPHFCKSALSRYTQWDFINLVKKYHIPFHEKTLGQLFCDHKAKDILNMLLAECELAAVEIRLNVSIEAIEQCNNHHFKVSTTIGEFHCESLVLATGGLSIPTLGASPFGYSVAEQFGLKVWPVRAGLVPFTLSLPEKDKFGALSGISLDCVVQNEKIQFHEAMLFTHRGLSGPAMLQISSYWQPGEAIIVDLLPDKKLLQEFKLARQEPSQKQLKSFIADYLPKRVVEIFLPGHLAEKKMATISHFELEQVANTIHQWLVLPQGTEGYRTAEVTLGGVDSQALSSKSMEVKHISGLFFIGEVVDVTGWLGGFNFQWAWSSGWAAGQHA
jgi:predicted Rossmann fold flavoprotein